ncbi:hypothetical protein CAPTEDRAFT_193414 [Capitella teleta]|uniref:Uncharacterized protein n=1 Tax=Capitella teleta TaxID=283909 RepID=R7TV44_CAPTE|nr:hypothetical protein CAPTEDRAFT_193414 [Capitella teleta]|eukprot:ELT97457.1 hypothetical protein CAPTEDRAFT_193414 [Capitella teleta]
MKHQELKFPCTLTLSSDESSTECDVGFFGFSCDEKCGRCQNSACSVVDGHCLDGCQTWFVGNRCKQVIVLPSLRGFYPWLRRVNDSVIILSWNQDSYIADEHSQYYGYTVAYALGSGSFQDGYKKADRDAEQPSATRSITGQASSTGLPGDASYVNVPKAPTKPVDESSRQYEALDEGRPKEEQDPYTAIEGVYQDINDAELA